MGGLQEEVLSNVTVYKIQIARHDDYLGVTVLLGCGSLKLVPDILRAHDPIIKYSGVNISKKIARTTGRLNLSGYVLIWIQLTRLCG